MRLTKYLVTHFFYSVAAHEISRKIFRFAEVADEIAHEFVLVRLTRYLLIVCSNGRRDISGNIPLLWSGWRDITRHISFAGIADEIPNEILLYTGAGDEISRETIHFAAVTDEMSHAIFLCSGASNDTTYEKFLCHDFFNLDWFGLFNDISVPYG